LVTGALDQSVRIWDAQTGGLLKTLLGHGGEVYSVAWDSTGTRIASGAKGGELRIWDGVTGASLQTISAHKGDIYEVDWDSTGTRVASAGADGTLRLWDGETGEPLGAPMKHGDWVVCVAWDPDGARVASASDDNTLRIRDGETGQLLRTLSGHRGRVQHVEWSPSGRRLVSCSLDKTVRIWSVDTGELLQTLSGHEHIVQCVSWDPTGTRIVSGSNDGSLRFWETRLDDALGLWRSAAARRDVEDLVERLFERLHLPELVEQELEADDSLSEEVRVRALSQVSQRRPLGSEALNGLAWKLVDPEREDGDSDVAHGLRLARAAVKGAPSMANIQDTLAWALVANGLYSEAIAASMKALELAAEDRKASYQVRLERVRAEAEEASPASPEDGR